MSYSKPVRLLSIDGGGIRGLSALVLLEQIMEMANYHRKTQNLDLLEPWQMFDMICGTSTGGLIAIMLGRLRMSIEECKEAYKALAEDAFTPCNVILRTVNKVKLASQYKTAPLEDAIKRTIGDGWEKMLLAENDEKACKVFVVAQINNTTTSASLRSYRNIAYPKRDYEILRVWQACRATSAALTFFDPIKINGVEYSDGGLQYNNPVQVLHGEASEMFKGREQIILSLGTGVAGPKKFDPTLASIAQKLADIATDTEKTANDFYKRDNAKAASEGRYFRFNVPGIGDMSMDEVAHMVDIELRTCDYLENKKVSGEVELCAKRLAGAWKVTMAWTRASKQDSEPERHAQYLSYILNLVVTSADIKMYTVLGKHLASAESPSERMCREKLYLTDPAVVRAGLDRIKGRRVDGTCEWISKVPKYCTWFDDSRDNTTRVLWILGGPGKGKTMMSVYLTEELEKHVRSLDAQLIYFFCDAGDENRNTAVNVLRSLVHQITVKYPGLTRHALPYFEGERANETLSSLETLQIIFKSFLEDPDLGNIFCVLDGLDECDEGMCKDLMPWLVKLITAKASQGYFKLIVVSQDIIGLRKCLSMTVGPDDKKIVGKDLARFVSFVEIDSENKEEVQSDVEQFVAAETAKLSGIPGFHKYRNYVQSELLKRAQGTFLWISYAMDELSRKETCTQVMDAFKEDLPLGLPAMYNRMLLRIRPDEIKVCRTILEYVAAAATPLRLLELAVAAGIQEGRPQSQIEQATRDAIHTCGPLLKIQEQGNRHYALQNCRFVAGSEVVFVHQSARDFLLRYHHNSNAVLKEFCMDRKEINLQIARRCLDCIAQSSPRRTIIDLDQEPGPEESALLRYATLYWPEHVKVCDALAKELFKSHVFFTSTNHSLRGQWWGYYSQMIHRYICLPTSVTPLLHIAAFLGLKHLINVVLAQRSWWSSIRQCIDKEDEHGCTPLYLAVRHGDPTMVKLLVAKGANVQKRDSDGLTILHVACKRGTVSVVELLLDENADLEARDRRQETPLHSAIRLGNEAVVALLISRGANVNAKDSLSATPLHETASLGAISLAQLLINGGADTNPTTSGHKLHTMPPLMNTVYLGENDQIEMVQFLLKHGADVDAKDGSANTILSFAVGRGQANLVEILLNAKAVINTTNQDGKSLLYLAVDGDLQRTHQQRRIIVQKLIEKGADVEELNNSEDAALYRNCKRLLGERSDDWEEVEERKWRPCNPLACSKKYENAHPSRD